MKLLQKLILKKDQNENTKISKSKTLVFVLALLALYNFILRPILSLVLLEKGYISTQLPEVDLQIINLLTL